LAAVKFVVVEAVNVTAAVPHRGVKERGGVAGEVNVEVPPGITPARAVRVVVVDLNEREGVGIVVE
jgi:hypothetical protein